MWCKRLNRQSMSRIDHFLITGNWEEHFTNTMLILLPRPMFDHSLILLEEGGVRRGMTPFRFESMWLKAEGFKDMVKGRWEGHPIASS